MLILLQITPTAAGPLMQVFWSPSREAVLKLTLPQWNLDPVTTCYVAWESPVRVKFIFLGWTHGMVCLMQLYLSCQLMQQTNHLTSGPQWVPNFDKVAGAGAERWSVLVTYLIWEKYEYNRTGRKHTLMSFENIQKQSQQNVWIWSATVFSCLKCIWPPVS